ncbi:uncharacterized protein LOC114246325 [Bombyx mandarina]|uniref:Uncharacterized protein LOC114246325 n=1 Tax=Bombyx mandarina TaxID=7092 RepID=A0A6J2JXL7_BOMMA|nr:uncharacterized protein LOC114246325 [Bombyx mandarina]
MKDLQKIKNTNTEKSSVVAEDDGILIPPRNISILLQMIGEPPSSGEWILLVFFNGQVVMTTKWYTESVIEIEYFPVNLNDPDHQLMVADSPIVVILRSVSGKGAKDVDPLLNSDNWAGGNVDLMPFVLGEQEIKVRVPLVLIHNGDRTNCSVIAHLEARGYSENNRVPLMITLLSVHCLPNAKDGTVYLGAIGLDSLTQNVMNFGNSLSFPEAKKIVWADVSNAGQAANTEFEIPNEDIYFPENVITPSKTSECNRFYWYSMKRVLIDPNLLQERLRFPFYVEMAGVPRFGKIDVRGRFMGFVDAGVLLEPGQFGVTVGAQLMYYNESELPEKVGPLLDLPPASAKASAREINTVTDEYGHGAYFVIRFDLFEPLVPKAKMVSLYERIGFPVTDGSTVPVNELTVEPPPEDQTIDVRRIRSEGGALTVHQELSDLACKGTIPMNQGIKRSAANRLLMRVRSLLKQFPAGNCSVIDLQDTVTHQHVACRRAVTASFAPRPPSPRAVSLTLVARCRIAGYRKLAEKHLENNLNVAEQSPAVLLTKVLRLLEEGNNMEAKNFLLRALNVHSKNRYLLWIYGALNFDQGTEGKDLAAAAFRIAVRGDYSDGTGIAIGWAALHSFYHYHQNSYAAFVAAKKMRKSFELAKEWDKFLRRWIDASGEEEIFWIPASVTAANPFILAAAFFLCLRCYSFVNQILVCVERNCVNRGTRFDYTIEIAPDYYYLQAASLLLRQEYDKAMEITHEGIKRFGPSAILSQINASCLTCSRGWDGQCESALEEADKAGAQPCPAILLRAALGGMQSEPAVSLQRAARAHKMVPSGYSAFVLARIYNILGEKELAERWAAAAVKSEPLLSDGWAFLALLALHERKIDNAKAMMRTANQVGTVSNDINEALESLKAKINLERTPDFLARNVCYSKQYD